MQYHAPVVLARGAGRLHSTTNAAKLVFLDPPYNIGMDYGSGSNADSLSRSEYEGLLRRSIVSACMTAAPGGAIALLISEAWADFAGAYMSEILPNRINRVIWHEKFAQYRETAFVPSHRHLFIHRKEGDGRRWNPDPIRVPSERMRMGDKRAKGPRVPSDVWTVRRLQGTSKDRVPGHPCQLPPEPLERLVLAYTNPGDLIAESFCGVGSLTRVAARLGRRYVGVDTNTDYVNIARQRGLDAIEEAQANEGAA